jgi:hypothetical protein
MATRDRHPRRGVGYENPGTIRGLWRRHVKGSRATGSGSVTRAAAAGAAGGIAGTVAMSMVMLPAGWLGLMGEQPPRRVVDAAARRTPPPTTPHDDDRDVAASLLHLAIGAGAGAAFGLARRGMARGLGFLPRPALGGVVFGLGLWALNYLALAPSLDILPPPDEDRPGRPPVMVLAHLVFGATCGIVVDRLATGPRRSRRFRV